MSAPTISVALCTHNGARFVREQVESILRQTVPVSEIVLSDDASTDDTVAIVEGTVAGWPSPRPRLVVIRNSPVLGVVANFEQATAACTGDLIALSDQDDVWRDDKLKWMVGVFDAHPTALLAHSDALLVTETLAPLPTSLLESLEITESERAELMDGRSYRAFLRRNLVTGATAVFRRELLDHARPFASGWIHDEWLAIIASAITSTRLLNLSVVDYRQHGGNQIGARKPSLGDKFRRLREPREGRNEQLLLRATGLLERLERLGSLVDPERVELGRGKLAHDTWRQALPSNHARRLLPIVGAVIVGRYSRYSRGMMDALRDLVQPAS